MKKLYRIGNPDKPIERDEVLTIYHDEKRFELELTTRCKSLKGAYEKFLRAFNEACADGAIDADLARKIRQWIEPRPYAKLIETLSKGNEPRHLSYETDDLSVFVGEVKDADGNFIGKWTFDEFGDDEGFYLLYILRLDEFAADDRLTAAQFSEKTQIPRQTLRRWACTGRFVPAISQGQGKPSYYTAEQIQQAIDLRKSLNQSKSTADDNQPNLFEEAATMNQDVQNTDNHDGKIKNVFDFEGTAEPAIVPAETSTTEELPATSAQIETIDVTAEVVTLDERANRIRQLQADVQRGIIEIGFELIAAKKEIGHGGWAQWLEKEFEWTQQTANRFMRIAERFGKLNNVVQFKPSTLQAMLTLPAGTEQEFIDEQAAAGKPVETQSARQVQNSVNDFKRRKRDVAFVEVDDEENKLSLRPNSRQDEPTADNPAVVTNDEPKTTADEFKTPLDSMRDDSQKVLDEIGELIHEADLTTLDATLKELLRIRDNLRGHVERKENANQQS